MGRKFEKVDRWMPSIVRVSALVSILWTVRIYTHTAVGFVTYFSSLVSIMLLLFMFETIFINNRLDKLERGKNGS